MMFVESFVAAMTETLSGHSRLVGTLPIILGLYWVYIGIMENEMETTTMGYIGIIGII